MKRMSWIIPIVLSLVFYSCETDTASESGNPLIGTWAAEVFDPNYIDTNAICTLTFTETEFFYSYKWIESNSETTHEGKYTFTDNIIFYEFLKPEYGIGFTMYRVKDNQLYTSRDSIPSISPLNRLENTRSIYH